MRFTNIVAGFSFSDRRHEEGHAGLLVVGLVFVSTGALAVFPTAARP